MSLHIIRGNCVFSFGWITQYRNETLLFWLDHFPTIPISLGSLEERIVNRSLEKREDR